MKKEVIKGKNKINKNKKIRKEMNIHLIFEKKGFYFNRRLYKTFNI